MRASGDRLDALATAAVGDIVRPPPDQVAAKGRRRRTRRRVLTTTASLSAVTAVSIAVVVAPSGSKVRVTTGRPPVTAPAGPTRLAAIASVSAAAASTVSGPPAQLGKVVGTTTSTAQALLDRSMTANLGVGKGTLPSRVSTTAISSGAPDVAGWWVLLTRHHACPPGCANAAVPTTDYLSVILRASDLHVVQVRDLGSNERNLSLAGPVYPLVLPGQMLPSSQPKLTETVVSAATVEAVDLKGEGCVLPAHLSGLRDPLPLDPVSTRCTSITVRLYPNWASLSDSVPGVVEPGLAFSQPSRPIYYVTIWGQLHFSFTGAGQGPAYVDHDNGIYDARTGQGEGGGTVGEPLP